MSDVYLWETYDRLGREALDRNDLQQANEAFRSAVATAEEIGAADRLVLSLRNLAATLAMQGGVADSYELLTRTLEVAKEKLGDQHSQTVESMRDLSSACRDLGYLDKAEGHLKIVLSHESLHAEPEQVCATLLELASLAMSRELPHQAAHYYDRVVQVRRKEQGEEHPEVAQALIWLSTALYKAGKPDEADTPLQAAFSILEKQFANEPQTLAQSLLAGSQMMAEAGQLEAALIHQKRALDIQAEHLEENDPQLWQTRELIASSLAGLGKVEESIELLEFGLRTQQNLEEHRKGALLKNLAGLYLTQGKNEKAEQLYSQAAEILERLLGPEHPAFLATQEERIQFFHFTKQPAKALELALKSIRATENRFGPGHPNTAQTYASTALLAFKAESWGTALELMKAAEKIWESLRPQPEDVLANCRANIATCLINLGQLSEAEVALNLAEETAGPSLRPVISNLRQQLQNAPGGTEAPTVEPSSPEPTPAAPPEPVLSAPEPQQAESPPAPAPPSPEPTPNPELVQEKPPVPSFETEDEPEPTPLEFPPEPVAAAEPVVPAEPETPAEPESAPPAEEALPTPAALEAEEETGPLEPVSTVEDPEAETGSLTPAPEAGESLESSEVSEPESSEETLEPEPPSPEVPPSPQVEEKAEEITEDSSAAEPTSEPETVPQSHVDPEAETAPLEVPQPAPLAKRSTEFVERRSAPRTPLALNRFFELKIHPSEGQGQTVKSFFVDLGPGGIRINTESAFQTDSELALTLPEELLGQETELQAKVVWQKELYGDTYLQGLTFHNLSPDQESLLNEKLQASQGKIRNSRQHFRLYRPFPIKLQPPGTRDWLQSYATDLSVDGVGTRLRDALAPGDELRVRLELEFELPTVEVEAKVAWSKESDAGITHGLQFASVGPVEAKTIKRYIDRCLEFSPD